MQCLLLKTGALVLAAAMVATGPAPAQNLDQIGVTLLRTMTTNVNGSGIRVAQPEANTDGNTNDPSAFEVNPADVNQPASRFIYFSAAGTATNTFPNSVGNESLHADGVGSYFYGRSLGVATNVAEADNYDADFFIENYVFALAPMPAAPVVNQSFTWGALSAADQQGVDSAYDDYAETFGTLFVSAACNYSICANVSAPGTSYNCISVGAYGGDSSIGPTIDNGRCKPDLTAPAGATSFSTPQVSGAVAVLLQAAWRGDGGSDTNAAGDPRTVKALLLNGAVKPADWTNASASPLDARYGAGVLNVFNAYEQLLGGKKPAGATNLISIGAAHPPVSVTNTVPAASAWNVQSLASTATNDAVNHYFFSVANGTVAATLVWNRQLGQTNINDLDLFLFNAANSNLVACSTSRVDNVEHLFVPRLAAGRYDLQVLKNGGTNVVSNAETYALAWAFVAPTLQLVKSGTNATLTWPVYPAGFHLEATTNLISASWNSNNLLSTSITNGLNRLTLNATNARQFFRLHQPSF